MIQLDLTHAALSSYAKNFILSNDRGMFSTSYTNNNCFFTSSLMNLFAFVQTRMYEVSSMKG